MEFLKNNLVKAILSEAKPDKKSIAPPGLFAGPFGKYYQDQELTQYAGKVVGTRWVPASVEPEEPQKGAKAAEPAVPKKRGRPRKPGPPDIDAVTAAIGAKTAKDVNNLIVRALKKGDKNPFIGGDGDQKLAVLNGLIKSAGQSVTATGPVHEVTIGLALDVLTRFPKLADDQVTRLLTEQLKKTKLGASLGPKLYETVNKAVMSAKAEKVRVELGMKNNGMRAATTVTEHYHGNAQSKSKLNTQVSKLVKDGFIVYTSEGIAIDPEDIPLLIKEAGSSAHGDYITPGDTFVVSVDSDSKKVILSTSSNKTARGDQSLNTTVLKELTDYRDSLSSLVDSGALSSNDLAKAEAQLKKTDDTISKLSSQVSDVFAGPVESLQDKGTQKQFIDFISVSGVDKTTKNLPKYYEQAVKPFMGFDPNKKKMSKRDERIRDAFISTGWKPGTPISEDNASKAWVHDMQSRIADPDPKTGLTGSEAKMVERFFATKGGGKVDTTQIRMKALEALQERHSALKTINCNLEGESVPVSSAVLGIFTARALHLEESLSDIPGNSKVYTKYRCYFKAVTGDIVGYPESNQKALGVSSFGQFCRNLELSEPKVAQKRGTEDGEAGTITFDIVSVTKDGQKKSICARVIRTKGGTALNIVAVPLRGYTDALAENQPKV